MMEPIGGVVVRGGTGERNIHVRGTVYPLLRQLLECSVRTSLGRWLMAAVWLCGTAAVSAQTRPLVVELFTSQGCSSCPPAEAYVGRLSTRPDVVALAFHVDYWDELGWRDRFGLAQSVQRQNVYARNLHHASVYTPQIVIDGRFDTVGADGDAVAKALAGQRQSAPLSVSLQDAELLVDVGAQPQSTGCDVLLVAYLRHALSAIGRGENAGRNLEEFNIVREVRTLGGWKGEPKAFRVPLSALPHDATDVAVLIQPSGQGPMVGAAVQPLR
jgi:hypothetical protein